MNAPLESSIRRIMADTFGIPASAIADGSTMKNTPGWSSNHHIELIMALEEAFGIAFDAAEFETMMSFPAVVSVVRGKVPRNPAAEIAEKMP